MYKIKFSLLLASVLFTFICCNKLIKNKVDPAKSQTETKTKAETKSLNDTLTSLEERLVNEGVNFYARGHEPSWALNMNFEGDFVFTTMNGDKIVAPAVKGEKAMDANVTRFYTETELGTLDISIFKRECEDSMTGKLFDYSVNIRFQLGLNDEFKELKGCGKYLPDLALHDIWVLDEINEENLTDSEFQKRPSFEFFSKDGVVLGHTGCNNFRGKFSIEGYKEIQFSKIITTLKSCSDMSTENFLKENVFDKRMKYSRKGMFLYLAGYDGTELKFKKVD